MADTFALSAREWLGHPGDESPFVYFPPLHSRLYVEALAEHYSPAVTESILYQACELEQRALALGYSLAECEHSLEEALPHGLNSLDHQHDLELECGGPPAPAGSYAAQR